MTTYVYETIPTHSDAQPKLYEIQQSMDEAPLIQHPETGEVIRRVVLGGYGVLKKLENSPSSNCCGDSGCC